VGKPERAPGLRERKKVQTREAIRRAAIELVAANGYAKTTVEQIAQAADVSHATFFRYFPSKESALLASGLAEIAVDALGQQPAGLPTLKAFRQALETTKNALSSEERQFEQACLELVFSIPELRELQYAEYRRVGARLAEVESRRLGRDPDDFEVQVFFGALIGVAQTAVDKGGSVPDFIFGALDFIESGMPLP
jgi:AcrR family transcriptional regulator